MYLYNCFKKLIKKKRQIEDKSAHSPNDYDLFYKISKSKKFYKEENPRHNHPGCLGKYAPFLSAAQQAKQKSIEKLHCAEFINYKNCINIKIAHSHKMCLDWHQI